MNWQKKALIGACAGLCLSFIKLNDANFYFAQAPNVVYAGYLMCICYILMSTLGALFINETDKWKLLRQSLLIPSIFLAIVQTGNPDATAPAGAPNTTPAIDIPELGAASNFLDDVASFFLPVALAQPDTGRRDTTDIQAPAGRQAGRQVEIITEKDLGQGIGAGVMQVWGRGSAPPSTFTFIVGRTSDDSVAQRIADSLVVFPAAFGKKVSLVRFGDNRAIYLTVGGLMTEKDAHQLQNEINAKTSILLTESDSHSKKTAQMLLNGQVVDVKGLVGK